MTDDELIIKLHDMARELETQQQLRKAQVLREAADQLSQKMRTDN
jgi:hypothetical protein